jgi:hypothetical protein
VELIRGIEYCQNTRTALRFNRERSELAEANLKIQNVLVDQLKEQLRVAIKKQTKKKFSAKGALQCIKATRTAPPPSRRMRIISGVL